ncbi:MAG TPA: glycosyltransferase family 4 protein [Dehalococcoidales bacterium]|nr:glycosyltransferase family 4 protein [Dehalococcoidales bacterium]
MKIALVSPYDFSYPGGVGRHIASLEYHFTRMGHDVKIIAPASSPITGYNGRFVAIGKPRPVPTSGSIARITISFTLANKVRDVLENEKFDIVHLHEPLAPTLCTTVLRLSRSCNIGTFHAAEARPSYRWAKPLMMSGLFKKWFSHLDGRIAVSKPAADFISKHYPASFHIIPNGIELDHYTPQVPPLPEYMDGKVNLLFLGRAEKRKGLEYLLKAYAILKPDNPQCRLIIVSPAGRLREKYEKQAADARLEDVIFVNGRNVSDVVKPRYYSSATIYCAPATGRESFGIVLLEAMATGKPVVASNISGYASVITNGLEGILVPPKQEVPLAQAIARILNNPDMGNTLGERGRIKAQNYGWDQIAARVLDFYRQTIKNKHSRTFV